MVAMIFSPTVNTTKNLNEDIKTSTAIKRNSIFLSILAQLWVVIRYYSLEKFNYNINTYMYTYNQ